MHHYQHNIGDYRRDTAHLSLLEHGIYRQILDEYYLKEKPIKTQSVLRRLRINTEEEKTALNNVLEDFFVRSDCGEYWSKNYCDEVISDYKSKVSTARVNGKKGGRPKKNQELSDSENPEKTQSVFKNNPEETGSKANQEPITNNQEPITNNQEPITNNQEPITNNHKPSIGSSEPSADADDTQDLFEKFYSEYPKKKNRGTAEKAFKKLNPDSFLVDQMISALESLKKTEDWKKQNGQFVPYPATWLNAKGWLDEINHVEEYSNLDDRELVRLCSERKIFTAGKSRVQLISELRAV